MSGEMEREPTVPELPALDDVEDDAELHVGEDVMPEFDDDDEEAEPGE